MPSVERREGQNVPITTDGGGRVCSGYKLHLNNLSSIWYGLFLTVIQSYIAITLSKRILDCLELSWDFDSPAKLELQACLTLTGLAIILMPVFFVTSTIKVGNLANDGFKIGRTLSTCALDPDNSLASGNGSFGSLWRHGGPTAQFLHIVIAFCLLLPNLIMQARLIQGKFLPKEYVWKTDLEFILASYDKLIVLNFLSSSDDDDTNSTQNSSSNLFSSTTGPQHMLLSSQQLPFSEEESWGGLVSMEFLNYALALMAYAVRYPAVFWNTNKAWGIIFSFQLFINGLQNLFLYIGVSVLYKVHVIGPSMVLTSLPSRYEEDFFLLNARVTLALLILTTSLVLSSSLALYLYGLGRFNAFLSHEKACKVISVESKEWGYLTHCAALCLLLAVAVVEGPLFVDLAVIYKSTMDNSVFISVIAAVLHLFIWVFLWLILTLKHNWKFKLRITVGKAAVRSARSIKLLTDVELLSSCESSIPLLVVASGRTYTVCDTSPKKTIIGAIHKSAMERKNKLQATANSNQEQYDDNEDQIYWLRPKPLSPKNSPDSEVSDEASWHKKAILKPKVTFNSTVKCAKDCITDVDDGDYARLRELPLMNSSAVCRSEKLAHDNEQVQYVSSGNRKIKNISDYEDPKPMITPEPPEMPHVPAVSEMNSATPKCLLRGDSGMPHDLTPRSDSDTSCSPPDHSETSSGVHSNSSRESHVNKGNTVWHNVAIQQRPVNITPKPNEVLICRRVESDISVSNNIQDSFGRCTNMKMTSFTDSQSATLPHFPTQQVGSSYPQCSTMPLPMPLPMPMPHLSCNYPRHSTIPSHHNGVRLFTPITNNIYAKRPQRYPHHSFPQLMTPVKYNSVSNNSERDSANFSMASSGDSDTYHS